MGAALRVSESLQKLYVFNNSRFVVCLDWVLGEWVTKIDSHGSVRESR